jgi:hypothetical protein
MERGEVLGQPGIVRGWFHKLCSFLISECPKWVIRRHERATR